MTPEPDMGDEQGVGLTEGEESLHTPSPGAPASVGGSARPSYHSLVLPNSFRGTTPGSRATGTPPHQKAAGSGISPLGLKKLMQGAEAAFHTRLDELRRASQNGSARNSMSGAPPAASSGGVAGLPGLAHSASASAMSMSVSRQEERRGSYGGGGAVSAPSRLLAPTMGDRDFAIATEEELRAVEDALLGE